MSEKSPEEERQLILRTFSVGFYSNSNGMKDENRNSKERREMVEQEAGRHR